MNRILISVFLTLLFVFPVQAAGQEAFVQDICTDSPNAYKEIMKIHKEQGFIAAQTKFLEFMNDPNSNCYRVPGKGRLPVIVLDTLQEEDLRDRNGMPNCVTLYRVMMQGQKDPTKKYFAVNFLRGMCDKDTA